MTIAVSRNLSNYEKSPKKKFFGASTGKLFFGLFSQLLKLRLTAMVTYSFHLYSRSSHHFIRNSIARARIASGTQGICNAARGHLFLPANMSKLSLNFQFYCMENNTSPDESMLQRRFVFSLSTDVLLSQKIVKRGKENNKSWDMTANARGWGWVNDLRRKNKTSVDRLVCVMQASQSIHLKYTHTPSIFFSLASSVTRYWPKKWFKKDAIALTFYRQRKLEARINET